MPRTSGGGDAEWLGGVYKEVQDHLVPPCSSAQRVVGSQAILSE